MIGSRASALLGLGGFLWALSAAGQMAQPQDPLRRLDPLRFGPGALVEAIEELDRYRPSGAVEPAQALLSHSDLQVARAAAWLLRRMGNGPEGVAAAAAVLLAPATSSKEARRSAALALGELRESSGAVALGSALSGDPEEEVRVQAALSLGELHRPGNAPALANALRVSGGDKSPRVRAVAARALGDLPDADPAVLTAALADPDAFVRIEAAWAIGRHRFPKVLGDLQHSLQSDLDCRVKAAAAWALGNIADPSVRQALQAASQGECRLAAQAAAWALSRMQR